MLLTGFPTYYDDWPELIYVEYDKANFGLTSTSGEDQTEKAQDGNVLHFRRFPYMHGYITNDGITVEFNVEKGFNSMYETFQTMQTPVMMARITNSETQALLTQADVTKVELTIYRHSATSSVRTISDRKPVSGWDGIEIPVADCFIDNPEQDPRVGFAPNFKHEPDTYGSNPFDDPGYYEACYKISPVRGNKIPVVFKFILSSD